MAPLKLGVGEFGESGSVVGKGGHPKWDHTYQINLFQHFGDNLKWIQTKLVTYIVI